MGALPTAKAIALWRQSDAVCFDVDSTVLPHEGIDRLALHCGAAEQVAEWTKRAMTGKVLFEQALQARLELIQPTRMQLDQVSNQPIELTPGVEFLVKELKARDVAVYLVSGGFRSMITPIAHRLGLDPETNVFANRILFHDDENETFRGFDGDEPTSKSGGKPRVIETLMNREGFQRITMIGDGVTDMEARPPAHLFIGFGGIVQRAPVQQGADWFVESFQPLVESLSPISTE